MRKHSSFKPPKYIDNIVILLEAKKSMANSYFLPKGEFEIFLALGQETKILPWENDYFFNREI